MKHSISLLLLLSPVAFVSCDYNPNSAGQSGFNNSRLGDQYAEIDPYAQSFTAGSFKQTTSPESAFYMDFPRGMEQPTKNLPNDTDVKIISINGSYAKVEVVDTGEIGFIPSVMLAEKRSENGGWASGSNNEAFTAPKNVVEEEIPSIEPIGMGGSYLPAE